MNANDLIEKLSMWTIHASSEGEMQREIAQVLGAEKIPFERELVINSRDRIDFAVGQVGIECKISGAYTQVLRQLSRYAETQRFTELLLVTTKAAHRGIDGQTLLGIPIRVHWINNL